MSEARGEIGTRCVDEGRLEAGGSVFVDKVIVNQGEVVRPSQLIARVRRTRDGRRG